MRRVWRLLVVLPLIAGCAFWRSAATLPSGTSMVHGQLVVHSDFTLPRHHRLLEELEALRGDMGRLLDLPMSDEPIHVYLFEDAHPYRSYMASRYPDFPDRRAFFIESDTRLTVYAHWGDRVGEDLRHEVAHGYLHAVTPHVPLWLDEGLAEFFEQPRGLRGRHQRHIDLLSQRHRDRTWIPDLKRLESIPDVEFMTQTDYAEAWLWIHFLLETSRDRVVMLQAHLAELRRTATVVPFSQVIYSAEPLPEEALAVHLASLSEGA